MNQNFRMIDVGEKSVTRRRAVATGTIHLSPELTSMVRSGISPKGNILAMAEVAGIMAAKNTASTLPLCHPLALDSVKISFEIGESAVKVFCEALCHAKTGVEMEALMGVNAALLTIYDLAKAVDPALEITDVHLVSKEGGKSGLWRHPKEVATTSNSQEPIETKRRFSTLSGVKGAVVTLSDRAAEGIYDDQSGPILVDYLRSHEAQVGAAKVISDDPQKLKDVVTLAIEQGSELILITGGTGLASSDITPETIRSMASKELTGFGEKQRLQGASFTPLSWLSRSSAFVVGPALVVLFPGSPKAVRQGLQALGDLFPHAIKMLRGGNH